MWLQVTAEGAHQNSSLEYKAIGALFGLMKMPRRIETSLLEGCKCQAKLWVDEDRLGLGFEMEMRCEHLWRSRAKHASPEQTPGGFSVTAMVKLLLGFPSVEVFFQVLSGFIWTSKLKQTSQDMDSRNKSFSCFSSLSYLSKGRAHIYTGCRWSVLIYVGLTQMQARRHDPGQHMPTKSGSWEQDVARPTF